MAVLHFNEGDYLQTKVVDSGIYPSRITKFDGPQKSSSGKGNNFFCDITIADGPFKGKTRTIAFSTGTQSASLLGEMQWFPYSQILLIAQALGMTDGSPQQTNIDTSELLNQELECAWGQATVEGRLINVINGFYKSGYAEHIDDDIPF